jgi:HEAT repeat protein
MARPWFGALLALAVVGALPSGAQAAPRELSIQKTGAQPALGVELAADGFWFHVCPEAPCAARAGRRLDVPASVLALASSGTLEVVELSSEQRVAHARVPISADAAWEAIIAAGNGQAEPVVVFAGVTGLTQGEDGQRSGDVLWIRNDDKGRRVLVGRAREDVQLCGRPTLLEPLLLGEDSRLRPVKVQQLPLEERRAARVLEATRSTSGPTPGGNALRAVAASSAIGDPGALTDGRTDSVWAEARGGDGRGEFVMLRPLGGVSLAALELLVRPAEAAPALGGAPRSLWLATRGALYRIDWSEDAWQAPGGWYRVELPAPLETDCLALVLEKAWSERSDTQVTLAELRGVGSLQLLAPAELVARLSTPGEPGAAAVPALLQLGSEGIDAVIGAFGALDALGRARSLDVLENADCDASAAVYTDLLDEDDPQTRRRAEQRLRACGAAAEPALRSAFERGSGESGVQLARELALVAPALAVELLGPRLAAAAAEQRPGYRDALSRAARQPAAQVELRRLLETPALGTAADVEVLRALGEFLPSLEPQASMAFARAFAAARSFEQRYVLLAPASRLAATHAGAAQFIEAALNDADPYLRGAAVRLSPPLVRLEPRLLQASRDPGVRVREAAALRLGELGVTRAAAALIERLRDDRWPLVRSAAARSLAAVGPAPGVDAALVAALADAAPNVRVEALRALGARGARSAVPRIAARLRDEHEVAVVRAAAVSALAGMCDASQLDELTRLSRALLADRPAPDDVVVASAALAALGRLAPADLQQRLAPFQAATSRPALAALVDAARRTEDRCNASPNRSTP